ncbi:MAG: DUF2065 domain-containing protein [Pseudomonadales bacterium]|nr:DUF2065 domain-containing protein [Pseudomonadales bacterium]
MWDDLFRAMCLMLVLEGLLPFIAPGRWREMVQTLGNTNDRTIRMIGLGSMLTGAFMLYLINRG